MKIYGKLSHHHVNSLFPLGLKAHPGGEKERERMIGGFIRFLWKSPAIILLLSLSRGHEASPPGQTVHDDYFHLSRYPAWRPPGSVHWLPGYRESDGSRHGGSSRTRTVCHVVTTWRVGETVGPGPFFPLVIIIGGPGPDGFSLAYRRVTRQVRQRAGGTDLRSRDPPGGPIVTAHGLQGLT